MIADGKFLVAIGLITKFLLLLAIAIENFPSLSLW
jgi:hypothetical protein